MKITSSLFVVALVIAFSAAPAQDKSRRSSGSSSRDSGVRSQGTTRSSSDRAVSNRSSSNSRGTNPVFDQTSRQRERPPVDTGRTTSNRGSGRLDDRITNQGRSSSSGRSSDDRLRERPTDPGRSSSRGNDGGVSSDRGQSRGGYSGTGQSRERPQTDSNVRAILDRGQSNRGSSSNGQVRERPGTDSNGRAIIDRGQNRNDQIRDRDKPVNGGRDNRSLIDRGNDRGFSSRSGQVSYGSSNNNYRDGRDKPGKISHGRAPDFIYGNCDRRSWNNDRISFWINSGAVRVGYWGYDSRWSDDRFVYPHYVFDPFGTRNCFVSPWYYYSHLPGYVYANRCTVVTVLPPVFVGASYSWNRPRGADYRVDREYNDLDYALEDLTQAFEEGDRRSLDRLVPSKGNINIYVDGRYSYSLGPDDFQDMIADNIRTTRTERYEIVETRYSRDEAKVIARHVFSDSWGSESVVWHTIRLSYERGGAVIREFGTSNYRP